MVYTFGDWLEQGSQWVSDHPVIATVVPTLMLKPFVSGLEKIMPGDDFCAAYGVVFSVSVVHDYVFSGKRFVPFRLSDHSRILAPIGGTLAGVVGLGGNLVHDFMIGSVATEVGVNAFGYKNNTSHESIGFQRFLDSITEKPYIIGATVGAAEFVRGFSPNNSFSQNLFWAFHSLWIGGLASVAVKSISNVLHSSRRSIVLGNLKAGFFKATGNLEGAIETYKRQLVRSTNNKDRVKSLLALGEIYDSASSGKDGIASFELRAKSMEAYRRASSFMDIGDSIKLGSMNVYPWYNFDIIKDILVSVDKGLVRKARRLVRKAESRISDVRVGLFSAVVHESLGDVETSRAKYKTAISTILSSKKYGFRDLPGTKNKVMVVDDPFFGNVFVIKRFELEDDARKEFALSNFVYDSIDGEIVVQLPVLNVKNDLGHDCIYRMVEGVDLLSKFSSGFRNPDLVNSSLDCLVAYMALCSPCIPRLKDYGIDSSHPDFSDELNKAVYRLGLDIHDQDIANGIVLVTKSLEQRASVFTHGDFHVGNCILMPDGCIGIIDNEKAGIGTSADGAASFLTSSYLGVRSDLSEFVTSHYNKINERVVKHNYGDFVVDLYFSSLRNALRKAGVATERVGGIGAGYLETRTHRDHYLWVLNTLFDNSRRCTVNLADVRHELTDLDYDKIRRFGDKILSVSL